MAFKFEDLRVWQRSIQFATLVHEKTLNWPKSELYVLTSQIKRAADSVCLNIAEGSTGQSNKEFSRFLGIAVRSGIEVISCLYLALNRKLVDQNTFDQLYNEMTIIIRMIQALRNSIKTNISEPSIDYGPSTVT